MSSEKAYTGVDFSGSAAYLGVVKNGTVLGTLSLKSNDKPVLFFHTMIDWLKAMEEAYYIEPMLWIEEPWVSAGHFPQTALKLVRTATMVEMAAYEAGIEPCFVHPSTWRKKIYGHGRHDDLKELARVTAHRLLGYNSKFKNEHNICEALLIAHYGSIIDGESTTGQPTYQESGSTQSNP